MLILQLTHSQLDCGRLVLRDSTNDNTETNGWNQGSNLTTSRVLTHVQRQVATINSTHQDILTSGDSGTPISSYPTSNIYMRVNITTTALSNPLKIGGTNVNGTYWLAGYYNGSSWHSRLFSTGTDNYSNKDSAKAYCEDGTIDSNVIVFDDGTALDFYIQPIYDVSVLVTPPNTTSEAIDISDKFNKMLDTITTDFSDMSVSIDSVDLMNSSSADTALTDGLYVFVYTIPFFSIANYTPVSYYFFNKCSAACCVKNLIIQIPSIYQCSNCDNSQLEDILLAKDLLDGLCAAVECGNYNVATQTLAMINKICNFRACNDCQ